MKTIIAVTVALATSLVGYVLGGLAAWWCGGYWELQRTSGLLAAALVLVTNALYRLDESKAVKQGLELESTLVLVEDLKRRLDVYGRGIARAVGAQEECVHEDAAFEVISSALKRVRQ